MELHNIVIDQAFIEERPLSASSIKAFRKSPKHYIQYLFGERVERDAYIQGNLIDTIITQPEQFDNRILIYEKPNLRTNAGRDEMAGLRDRAAQEGKQLATQEEVDIARECFDNVMRVDMARDLIESRTRGQIPLQWRNRRYNLPLRGYADMESNAWGEQWVVEVKTTGKEQGADPDKFLRDALSLGYDIQVAAYADAYKTMRFSFPNFIFLVVEVVEPYNCSVILCPGKFMEQARREWLGSLAAFRYCMDRNLFGRGYDFRLHTMDYFAMEYPGWVKPLYANFDIENIKD